MAEEENGWWNSWIQTAKEKSSSVFELVKHDLAEFTQTVQQETSSAVSAAASSLKEKLRIDNQESTANQVKRSVSTFLGSVSTAFTPVREVEGEDDVCIIQNMEPIAMDRLQLQVLLIQRDQSTYLEEPSDDTDRYEKWLESFDLDSKQDEIRELVVANSVIRNMYTKLVPTSVSHMVFWHRYFYRFQQLTDAEKRRLDLKERVASARADDCLSWDEDDDFGHQELTPQQTDMLLMEYQQECEQGARCEPRDEVPTSENLDLAVDSQSVDCSELVLPTESDEDEEHRAINQDSGIADVNLPSSPAVTCTEACSLPETLDKKCEEISDSVKNSDSKVLDDNAAPVMSPDSDAKITGSEESSLSNEEEWEKDFDIGDIDAQNAAQDETLEARASTDDPNAVNAENDWESWE